jgi:ribonuclease HI
VDSNSCLLQPQFITTHATHFKGFPLQSPILDSRSKDWVGIWSPLLSSSVFGRIIEKHQFTHQVLIQHWVHDYSISNYDEPCLAPCNGCILHTTNQDPCSFWAPINLAIVLQCTVKRDVNSRQLRFLIDGYSFLIAIHYNFSTRNLSFMLTTLPPPILQENLILRYIESGSICNQLLEFQHAISDFSNLEFYTDGSVQDLSTEQCSMTFAFMQTLPSAPAIQFSSTIKKWCSSNHAELFAIFVTLLISSRNATITIYTDSKSIIDHYDNFSQFNYPFLPRNIFKQSSNISLWSYIFDIIHINSLSLSFVKVKAHSGNLYNEQVDTLARLSHDFNALPLIHNVSQFTSIHYFPLWKNIPIEINLRQFLTSVSRNIGFEKFLYLHRNSKYVNLDVDWGTTFFILNDDENSSITTTFASNHKSCRIKYLFEELPTVEHVKLRHPDLYDGWNCPSCKNEKKTFSHIWLCQQHRHIMNTIIFNQKKELVRLIRHFGNTPGFSSRDLLHDDLWIISFRSDRFTFIDLIKGVVPLSLFNIINSFLHNNSLSRQILSVFINNIFIDINQLIWQPRCDRILLDEYHAGITKHSKRQICPSDITRSPTTSRPAFSNFTNLGIVNSIDFGGEWLSYYSSNFWIVVNCVIFLL